jgi:hypothetical protein
LTVLVVACGSDPGPRVGTDTGNQEGGIVAVEVRQVTPEDSEVAESWARVVPQREVDALGVDAARFDGETEWAWQVGVNAMEFIRADPLESEVRSAFAGALRSVPGVRQAEEEDREVWIVDGDPSGEDLVRAVAEAMAPFEARIRAVALG